MIQMLDLVSVYFGRTVAFLGIVCFFGWAVFALLDKICKRAGMLGLFFSWLLKEHAASPRGFWAKVYWGGEEDRG